MTPEVWDKLTSFEKKQFTEIQMKQLNNIELTSKQVTKKVNLPYTIVEDEIISEPLDIKDDIVQSIANKMATKIDSLALASMGAEDILIAAQAGMDLAKGKDKSVVGMWSNQDDVMHFQNQTKTIYNKDPFALKDPVLLHHYKMPIKYDLWVEYPELGHKYKVGSHHKIEGMVFEVVEHEKNILKQEIVISFVEEPNIGITGPDDNMMDGIGNGDSIKDLFGSNGSPSVMDEKVSIDELTITVPAEEPHTDPDTGHINLKERSERSKMFYELTHGVDLE